MLVLYIFMMKRNKLHLRALQVLQSLEPPKIEEITQQQPQQPQQALQTNLGGSVQAQPKKMNEKVLKFISFKI